MFYVYDAIHDEFQHTEETPVSTPEFNLAPLADERKNGPKELMAFFSVEYKGICTDVVTPGAVGMSEYRDFWSSLSEEEKVYYRQVELV